MVSAAGFEMDIAVFVTIFLGQLLLGSAQNYPGETCKDNYGNMGTCLSVNDCSAVRDMLEHSMRPTICSFDHSDPIVCCVGREGQQTTTTHRLSYQPPTLPPPGPLRKPGEVSKYYCDHYREKYCPFVAAVAGGTKASAREFPHMAALGYGDKENIQWACGGTLISKNFVLTAAHCMHGGRLGPVQWVLLDTEVLVDLESPSSTVKGETYPVIQRIRHPEYKPPAKYNDVALLEIGPALGTGAPLELTRKLHPACLPFEDHIKDDDKAIATGWGRTGFGESASQDLLKVELDIFNSAICNKTYDLEIRTTQLLRNGIDSTMICAGKLEGGKDTCQGDSGGPLQVSKSGICMYEIWGITSFGKICAFSNSPAVYMRVHEYIPWIESIVWPVSKDYLYFF